MKNRNQFEANDANQSDYFSDFGRNERSGRSSGASKTLVAIAAGAAAGAVTAMLLTPKTGAETRKAISRGASKVSDTVKQGIDMINTKVDELKSMGDNLKNDTAETIKQGLKNTGSSSNFTGRGQENYTEESQPAYGRTGSKSTGSKTGNV